MGRVASLLLSCASLWGCGASDSPVEGAGGAPLGCNPGELELEDGSCRVPGITPELCGEGFAHDGDVGCEPVLPPEPCQPGAIAVPGDTSCREVAPCGSGPWGNAPVDADTVYVDASYAGGNSDGTSGRPWTRIADAVTAATAGAIVAIAAGSYSEDVLLWGKPVRFWGRCPSMVTIVGSGADFAAVKINPGTHGAELHDLAVTGPQVGVHVEGSEQVLVERVWVHDVGWRGVNVEDSNGAASLTVRGTLIESAVEVGVFALGSEALVEDSLVRSTRANAQGMLGHGMSIVEGTDAAAELTIIRGSVVEQNQGAGMSAYGAPLAVEDTVVRGTVVSTDGHLGFGVVVEAHPATGTAAVLNMLSSLIEGGHEAGLIVSGADATADAIVVRDVATDAMGLFGRGVQAQLSPQLGAPATVVLSRSFVVRNREVGINVVGATMTVDGVVVRETGPNGLDALGDGILVMSYQLDAAVTVTASRVERNARAGVTSFAASAELAKDRLACQPVDLDGEILEGMPYTIADLGGNACGCNEGVAACQVVSTGLEPPLPPP